MPEKMELPVPESRLYRQMDIPNPKIFRVDAPLVFYNGRIYRFTEDQTGEDYIKVFGSILGFSEVGTHRQYEEEYFSDENNTKIINIAKKSFIRSLLARTTDEERKIISRLGDHILKKIKEHYSAMATSEKQMFYVGRGRVRELSDSLFSSIRGYERVLMLDEKLYDLLTIPEFLAKFKHVFEPSFFSELQRMAVESKPEQVSKYLTVNVHRMNKKALPSVRNKIWHSERSCKLFFDGVYFIPEYRGSSMVLLDKYKGLYESRIKIVTINEYALSEV